MVKVAKLAKHAKLAKTKYKMKPNGEL